MSTRNLHREAQAAAMLIEHLRGVLDPDDDQVLISTLEGETELLEAIDVAMAQIADDEALAGATQRQIEQLEARKSWCAGRVERVKSTLKSVLERFPEISGTRRPFGTIFLGRAGAMVEIYDPDVIPDYYKRVPEPVAPVPDKKKIAEALKAGDAVPGARLKDGATFLGVRK